MQGFEGQFTFKGSWKLTYLGMSARPCTAEAKSHKPVLEVTNFYSDLLYQSFHCATAPLHDSWLTNSNVDKRAKLSLEDFREKYELENQPVVITDVVSAPNFDFSMHF